MMYLSAALQFNSVVTVIIRSLCTKMVDAGEKGRVFAVVALGQALVPMVVGPALGSGRSGNVQFAVWGKADTVERVVPL